MQNEVNKKKRKEKKVKKEADTRKLQRQGTLRAEETERVTALNLDDFLTVNANPSRGRTAHLIFGSC